MMRSMALSEVRNFKKRVCGVFCMPLALFLFGGLMSDYRALYRKWRPETFDSVCGQDAITDILKYEVANNKLSHAYLFCGSRGTGKTSCAKILAKAVNCLDPKDGNPCCKCSACRSIEQGISTDVIEMDAASNNGVDNVRDMKDEIAFTPAELKYRVYIIDEVHMMSGAAFNALLKTLEEPPSYVLFILATTEYNKLPTTIVSRCQRFDFRRISTDVIVKRLKQISENEGIDLDEDGSRVIARISRGGMRDAVSLLELCAGSRQKIDAELVFSVVGSGNRESAYGIIEAILASNYSAVYSIVNDVVMNSGDLSVFWQEIIDSYRDIMIVKNSPKAKDYLDLTDAEHARLTRISEGITSARLSYHVSVLEKAMADMQRAFNSKRSIAEIALTRMCDAKSAQSPEALALRIEELEKSVSMLRLGIGSSSLASIEESVTVLPTVKAAADEEVLTPALEADNNPNNKEKKIALYGDWTCVVEKIAELKRSLASRLKDAKVYKVQNGPYLVRLSDFFAKMISSNPEELAILRGIIAEVDGISPDNVEIAIEPLDTRSSKYSDELDSILN